MNGFYCCTKCKHNKPNKDFQLNIKGLPTGQCRSCKTDSERNRRLKAGIKPKIMSKIVGETKLCLECKEFKNMNEFSPSKRGLGGLSTYCRHCFLVKFKNKDKNNVAVKKYRQVNRHKYLANHRLIQFKRKSLIKITSDSSVTDCFLRNLYDQDICFYCEQFVSFNKRTMDHKIPLIRGGVHSASNLVMACLSCNSSKSFKTDKEFKGRIND